MCVSCMGIYCFTSPCSVPPSHQSLSVSQLLHGRPFFTAVTSAQWLWGYVHICIFSNLTLLHCDVGSEAICMQFVCVHVYMCTYMCVVAEWVLTLYLQLCELL